MVLTQWQAKKQGPVGQGPRQAVPAPADVRRKGLQGPTEEGALVTHRWQSSPNETE